MHVLVAYVTSHTASRRTCIYTITLTTSYTPQHNRVSLYPGVVLTLHSSRFREMKSSDCLYVYTLCLVWPREDRRRPAPPTRRLRVQVSRLYFHNGRTLAASAPSCTTVLPLPVRRVRCRGAASRVRWTGCSRGALSSPAFWL